MGDKEGIVPSSGTSSGREMRDKSRVNYAKLHSHGKGDRIEAVDDFYESENVEELVSDKLGQSGMQPLGASGDISDLDPGSQNAQQMTEEMEQIDREMRFLADQEALLEKSQQLREKRLALQQMRQKVSKLRGMDSHSESILKHKVVSKTTNKPVKKTKAHSEPKTRVPLEPRVIINSSDSARTTHVEQTSSDSENEINIKTLRKDKKLRKSVRKELKSLGLHCEELSSASISDNSSSESTSSYNSDTSDDDSSSNRKVKKEKKHKSKKNKNK